MVGGQGHVERLAREDGAGQLLGPARHPTEQAVADDDVVVGGQGGVVLLRHVRVTQLDLDPLGRQLHQGWWHEELGGTGEGRDPHRPGGSAPELVEPGLDPGQRRFHVDGLLGKEPAGVGEAKPASDGFDERDTEVALGRAQLLGHGRAGAMGRGGHGRDAPPVGELAQEGEVADVHVVSLSVQSRNIQ